MVKAIIRLESFLIFLLALYFYQQVSGNWLLFVLLFLLPDIAIIGFLKDKKIGAIIYNLIHNYILALVLIVVGMSTNIFVLELGFILLAHVGIDRCMGFGLKYPSHFKDTHIQKL